MANELIPALPDAAMVKKQLPHFEEQYDYHEKLTALKGYTKDKNYYISHLEAEAAMADTIGTALKSGDVTVDEKNNYVLANLASVISGGVVSRWRQVRDIKKAVRFDYYKESSRPSRQGLFNYSDRVETQKSLGPGSGYDVITGRWQKKKSKVVSNSVDLIFTDPPYFEEFIPEYGELAEWAADVLVEGGSLIAYAGHYALPEICNRMGDHLKLWWINACIHTKSRRFPGKNVFVGWKPMVWFVKSKRASRTMVADTVTGGSSKQYHAWGQDVCEAAYYIEHLSRDGGLILDPYIGGGTTGVAAVILNRNIVGFEMDKDQAKVARQRIKEAVESNA